MKNLYLLLLFLILTNSTRSQTSLNDTNVVNGLYSILIEYEGCYNELEILDREVRNLLAQVNQQGNIIEIMRSDSSTQREMNIAIKESYENKLAKQEKQAKKEKRKKFWTGTAIGAGIIIVGEAVALIFLLK